jgi:hypothetical protein
MDHLVDSAQSDDFAQACKLAFSALRFPGRISRSVSLSPDFIEEYSGGAGDV